MKAETLRRLQAGAELFAAQAEQRGLIAAFHLSPDELLRLIDERAAAVAALKLAVRELNEIRARDGVPYTHQGFRASVTPEHFSAVVDACFDAIARAGEP